LTCVWRPWDDRAHVDEHPSQSNQSTTISVRTPPEEVETLDRLVVACRAYYERQAPPFNRLAGKVTRSSALRDLLRAWRHGFVGEFSYDLTTASEEEA
jgi:hypothetical protein